MPSDRRFRPKRLGIYQIPIHQVQDYITGGRAFTFPSDAIVTGVHYAFETEILRICVESASFGEVAEGCQIPYINMLGE